MLAVLVFVPAQMCACMSVRAHSPLRSARAPQVLCGTAGVRARCCQTSGMCGGGRGAHGDVHGGGAQNGGVLVFV